MSRILPAEGAGFWPLVGMGAILGGTMRSPFTGVIFALELTHDVSVLLPLLVAATLAHGFTVLTLRRSILTEKVSRRGYHLSREYAIDPLETLSAREVMRTNVAALPAEESTEALAGALRAKPPGRGQRLYPVLDAKGCLTGVVTRSELRELVHAGGRPGEKVADIAHPSPMIAYPDEPLRAVAYRMAASGLTQFPVVERGPFAKLAGMITLKELLLARTRNLEEESRRERVLHTRFPRSPTPQHSGNGGGDAISG